MSIQKIKKIKKSHCFGCSPIYGTPLLLFFNPQKNKKRPLRFYPQEPLEELHVSIQPGLLAIDIIPHFHSYFKPYLQEKDPQPKPEVFSQRKDVYDGKPSECQ